MYDDLKTVLGASDTKHLLAMRNRYSGKKPVYVEYIYVWRKGASGGARTLPAPTWSSPYVRIGSAGAKGRGVFAKVDIPKGTRLDDYKGEQISFKEFVKRHGDDRRFYYNLLAYGVLDGHKYLTKNISHYVNEGSRPNALMKKRGLYAAKDVKAGEEILLAYPKNYPRGDWD